MDSDSTTTHSSTFIESDAASMRWLILIFALLLCCFGWWMGIFAGIAVSLLVATGLILIRYLARRSGTKSDLALMPNWQIILVPILGLPIGVGIGITAFVFGPGF